GRGRRAGRHRRRRAAGPRAPPHTSLRGIRTPFNGAAAAELGSPRLGSPARWHPLRPATTGLWTRRVRALTALRRRAGPAAVPAEDRVHPLLDGVTHEPVRDEVRQ